MMWLCDDVEARWVIIESRGVRGGLRDDIAAGWVIMVLRTAGGWFCVGRLGSFSMLPPSIDSFLMLIEK